MLKSVTESLDDDLRIAIMRLSRRMRLERVDGDVTDGQLSVLIELLKHGPQTLGALSERERVTPPSMNRTINALITVGMVTRSGSPDDGRKVLIEVSDVGAELARETKRRRAAWFSLQLGKLSREDRAVVDKATPILRELADS
jgi:DNA-binding MarR family transcriptional regulator